MDVWQTPQVASPIDRLHRLLGDSFPPPPGDPLGHARWEQAAYLVGVTRRTAACERLRLGLGRRAGSPELIEISKESS